MKLLPVRIAAQLIDIIVCFAVVALSFMHVLPLFLPKLGATGAAVLLLVLVVAVNVLIQLPFLKTGQTIGKAFAGLEVISTDPQRPLTLSIMLSRELLCKLASCYIICIPVLAGGRGGHEEATKTAVIAKPRPAGRSRKRTS